MTFIYSFIIALIIIVITAIIINGFEDYNKDKFALSFKESMNSVKVPIVTLESNGISLNFLIDTGADYSYLDVIAVEGLKASKTTKEKINIITGGGTVSSLGNVTLTLNYDKHKFEDTFVVTDLTQQFKAAFNDKVILHGVLGTKFLKKHKYILDFNKETAYIKNDHK